MKKRVLYGVANYEELVRKHGYFVDKTRYIERLEQIENPVFLRPWRFGKSLLCRILECYYNINQQEEFEELFGQTYIGQHPTPLRNSFFVLHLDFSTVDPTGTLDEIEASFDHVCNLRLKTLIHKNASCCRICRRLAARIPGSTSLAICDLLYWQPGLSGLWIISDAKNY